MEEDALEDAAGERVVVLLWSPLEVYMRDRTSFTIAFCSGRRLLVPVVEMLVCRLRALRYADRLRLRLVVVWDRSLEGEEPPQLELRSALAGVFAEVRWLDPAAWHGLLPAALQRHRAVRLLLEQPGYAARRNLALLDAVAAGTAHLLFLDDDEYFVAPYRAGDGRLRWRAVDPLGPHLDGFARGADITNGAALGQPSPVPAGLAAYVPDPILRRLGRALSLGNEVVDESTFVSGRLCLAPPELPAPRRVPVVDGVRRLRGGNLALNLIAVRAGRLPPFFAPPYARGEDTFLGARAHALEVLRVPAYVFHDPFGLHTDVPAGARPAELSAAAVTRDTIERFGRAFLGWVRYAPLLLRLRSASGAEYRRGIVEMRAALSQAAPALVTGLEWEGFASAVETLERCHRRSEGDLADLRAVDSTWFDLVSAVMPAFLIGLGRDPAQRAA